MKDHPTVYVIENDDGDVEKHGFYEYDDAVKWCQDQVAAWGLDRNHWDCYFRLYTTTIL